MVYTSKKTYQNDYCSKLVAVKHAFNETEKNILKKIDICVDLDITSPLRKINDIKKALLRFKKLKSEFYSLFVKLKKIHILIWLNKKGYINLVKRENEIKKIFIIIF